MNPGLSGLKTRALKFHSMLPSRKGHGLQLGVEALREGCRGESFDSARSKEEQWLGIRTWAASVASHPISCVTQSKALPSWGLSLLMGWL